MPICTEWQLFPMNKCSVVVTELAFLMLLSIINWAAMLVYRLSPPRHRLLRSGSFTIFFYLTCSFHLLCTIIPILFVTVNLLSIWNSGFIWLAVAALMIHSTFWCLCLCRLIENRHYHEQPLVLVTTYALTCLLSVLPLFNWQTLFVNGYTEEYFFYYLAQVVFVLSIFFCVITKSTLKQTYYSPWDNFFSKFFSIWPYLWPKKNFLLQFYVVLCILFLLIGRIINIFVPLYSKWIVDALSGPDPFCYQMILVASLLKFLQGGGALGGFLNTIRSYLWIGIQQYTTIEIELSMFRHMHNLSLNFHLSRKTGEIVRIMNRGTSSINTLLSYILFNVVPTIVDILFAAIFFFVNFDAFFGFLVFITMSIYLVATIFLTEWRSKYRKDMNESENKVGSIAVDSLLNFETVKYHNAEEVEIERYKDAYKIYQSAEYKSNASLTVLNVIQNSIIGVGLVLGSLLAAYFVSVKKFTAGDYVLFTTYILQLYGPLNFFGTMYRVVQKSFIDMENMLDLFKEEVEICDSPNAIDLEKCTGSIEFRNVSFYYKPERIVLNDISFTVNPGETIALVGPSGSGKTTIARLLFRLYDATDGQILFNNHEIESLKIHSLRDRIGIVPQDTVLFNNTIRYNIQYGRPNASQIEIEDAAKAASIHDFIYSHPDGYDCLVGERGLKLSGGEKQRVAVARTILKDPEYIVLDEATSALDSKTERSIQRYLFDLCNRRTCVIVAHRLSTIVHAHKILVLNFGRIVETGTHDELLAKNGIYAEMWSLQNATNAESEISEE